MVVDAETAIISIESIQIDARRDQRTDEETGNCWFIAAADFMEKGPFGSRPQWTLDWLHNHKSVGTKSSARAYDLDCP